MRNRKECEYCGEELKGRVDQRFCNPSCKSSFHYEKSKNKEASFFQKVDRQLKLNRRILKNYNKAGKATVRSETLLEVGFDPKFFTHYWKNKKGDVYLFCFEFGFLKRKENDREKYVLVQWQDYMK
jgi:hypothetical protein